jgi:hypothetical protein
VSEGLGGGFPNRSVPMYHLANRTGLASLQVGEVSEENLEWLV